MAIASTTVGRAHRTASRTSPAAVTGIAAASAVAMCTTSRDTAVITTAGPTPPSGDPVAQATTTPALQNTAPPASGTTTPTAPATMAISR